jgi:hypothetical protein
MTKKDTIKIVIKNLKKYRFPSFTNGYEAKYCEELKCIDCPAREERDIGCGMRIIQLAIGQMTAEELLEL